MGDCDDIIARMTRSELALYRAVGGSLTATQQQRLLGKTMELLDWYQPPTSPGTRLPDPLLERRIRDARRALCPEPAAAVAEPKPKRRPKIRPPAAEKRRPNEVPVECVENPAVWFRSIQRAADVLGVTVQKMSEAVGEGKRLKGRLWRRRQRSQEAA